MVLEPAQPAGADRGAGGRRRPDPERAPRERRADHAAAVGRARHRADRLEGPQGAADRARRAVAPAVRRGAAAGAGPAPAVAAHLRPRIDRRGPGRPARALLGRRIPVRVTRLDRFGRAVDRGGVGHLHAAAQGGGDRDHLLRRGCGGRRVAGRPVPPGDGDPARAGALRPEPARDLRGAGARRPARAVVGADAGAAQPDHGAHPDRPARARHRGAAAPDGARASRRGAARPGRAHALRRHARGGLGQGRDGVRNRTPSARPGRGARASRRTTRSPRSSGSGGYATQASSTARSSPRRSAGSWRSPAARRRRRRRRRSPPELSERRCRRRPAGWARPSRGPRPRPRPCRSGRSARAG